MSKVFRSYFYFQKQMTYVEHILIETSLNAYWLLFTELYKNRAIFFICKMNTIAFILFQ